MSACEKVINASSLLKQQEKTLNGYLTYLLNTVGKVTTIRNNIYIVVRFAIEVRKPFEDVNKEDIEQYFGKLARGQTSNKRSVTEYNKPASAGYLNTTQINLKRFFKVVGNAEASNCITIKKYQQEKKTSDMMLTAEDILKLIECSGGYKSHAMAIRNKCIIAVIYEGALRRSEARNIKLKDIEDCIDYVKIKVNGKTGIRRVILIKSLPYIRNWLNEHAFKNEPNCHFFINLGKKIGSRIGEGGVHKIIIDAAKRAKINKKITSHILRHSRLDYLGQQGWTERDLQIFAGWTNNSNMPSVYLHYDEQHVHNKALEMEGVISSKNKKKDDSLLKPKVCPECNELNPPSNIYCKCGTMITQESIDSYKSKNKELDRKLEEAKTMMQKIEQMKRELEAMKEQV